MNNNFNELKKNKPKIRKNVFQIVNGLWCGDINTAMDYTYLNNKSISCLINCCEKNGYNSFRNVPFFYCHIIRTVDSS